MDLEIMKSSGSSNCFSNLDENLLVQILVRLPSREIFRLKSVCKRWFSLISSDYFVTFFNHRRHDSSLTPIYDLHSSSSSSFIFQFHRGQRGHIHLFDPWMWIVHGGGYPARLDLSFLPDPDRLKIRLRASCADLILCSQRDSQTLFYYVCNVRTKQFFPLSPVPFFREKAIGFLCVPASCSICHRGTDNSRYNFMVVRICKVPRPVSQYRVQLFSSQEGRWKKTMMVSSPRTLMGGFYGSFLVPYKRMLHWLTSTCVLVYDPYNSPEIFSRAIDLPIYNGIGPHCLGVFQDRLRVTLHNWYDLQGYAYHIWELEDYDMGEWSLVHKIFHRTMYNQAPDFKIEERGFVQVDGDAFGNTIYADPTIPYLIVDQPWPTPVPSLPYTTD